MRYASVFSGIEAATVAWHPLGWEPVFFAEIDKFPSAVLRHHYPHVPNIGDMTIITGDENEAIELLVGGSPCQDFSVAGLRAGMDGARGNLTLEFLKLAGRLRPRWLVWENVPGVESSWTDDAETLAQARDERLGDEVRRAGRILGLDLGGSGLGEEGSLGDFEEVVQTNDLSCFLAGLSELGYGLAYRVLDAQHFGVPQRRRRVFVVGYLGDWRRAAAVLFERHSMSGHPPPRREAGQDITLDVAPCLRGRSNASHRLDTDTYVASTGGGGLGTDFDCDGGLIESVGPLMANTHPGAYSGQDAYSGHLIAHSLRAEGFDASEDGTGRGTPLVPVIAPCLTQNYGKQPDNSDTNAGPMLIPVAFTCKDHGADVGAFRAAGQDGFKLSEIWPPITSTDGGGAGVPTIAFDCKASGRNGFGIGEVSPTLRAMGKAGSHSNGGGQVAVAMNLRGREGGAMPEMDEMASLRAASGGSSRSYVLYEQEEDYASTYEADSSSVLRTLRQQIGAEAVAEWGSRVLDSLQQEEVLQSWLHGESLRRTSSDFRSFVDDRTLSCTQNLSEGTLRSVWILGPNGRTPQGRGLAKQLAYELGEALQELPSEVAQNEGLVHRLRQGSEGARSLRQALSEIQEVRRSSGGEGQPILPHWAVRRLTPKEAERLQGFPDDYTLIRYHKVLKSGKLLKRLYTAADGPRYKALGNSMAVPVMRWIGERIDMVDKLFPEGA
jgi:DNA (cytosine-5)-methyltransferase 1